VLDSEEDGLLIDTIENSLAVGIHGAFSKEDPEFDEEVEEGESFVDQWYDEDDLVLVRESEDGFIFSPAAPDASWAFNSIEAGACASPAAPKPQGPDRYIYCAVAGNTWPDGTPIAPGTALNLPADQAASDPHYKGATIGFWVPGEGATCSLTPAQAALAAASTKKVNHVGGTGDYNEPEVYTLVG
jgi:hypothetical protein